MKNELMLVRSKMLEKNQQQQIDLDVVYADPLYIFVCKKCGTKFTDFKKYVRHVKKTKHIGAILQVISDDEMITLT